MSREINSDPHARQAITFLAARSGLRAARAILLEPGCRPNDAITHIIDAWRGYIEAIGTGQAAGGAIPPEVAERVPEATREQLARVESEPLSQPEEVQGSRGTMLDICDVLERAIAQSAEQRGIPLRTRATARRWLLRAATWAAPVLVLLLAVVRPWEALNPGPWRGAYYATKDFVGDPVLVRDKDIAFDWGSDPPLDSIPADRFSVRWDTCLELDEDTEVAFQLVADDGGRVYVDGKRIINDWKAAKTKPHGKSVPLTAGRHHLRVEYFEHTKGAYIHVLASFDDQPPAPIPTDMLSDPGEGFDETAPCNES
jgi:hypothetical protein